MYTFNRAIAIKPGINERWAEVDISNVQTKVLLAIYKKVYAVLTQATIIGEMTLDLSEVNEELQANTGTISNYLSLNGNKTLPTVMGTPVVMKNMAVFSDAFKAGFHVDTTDHLIGPGVILPNDQRPDLVVTMEQENAPYDYLGLQKSVLANVNGFYHRAVANSRGYYVLNGNSSSGVSKKNHLGLLSFGTMGQVDTYPITEDMLSFEKDPVTDRVDKVHILFHDGDLCAKTPILFLGGYMLLVDNTNVLLTSGTLMTFKTFKYPFVDRYVESHDHIDFGDAEPPHQAFNEEVVEYHHFWTEAFLRKYFTMSQSFIACVNADQITVERIYPSVETVPHTYVSYEKPKYPLVVAAGKHEVYWPQEEAGQFVINCQDAYRYNRMYATTKSEPLLLVDNILYSGHAGMYSPAYFLKMVKEEVVVKVT